MHPSNEQLIELQYMDVPPLPQTKEQETRKSRFLGCFGCFGYLKKFWDSITAERDLLCDLSMEARMYFCKCSVLTFASFY